MLFLPFMVFGSSSVSPIEDGSAKSNASIDPFNPDVGFCHFLHIVIGISIHNFYFYFVNSYDL